MTLNIPLSSFVELARSWGVQQAFVQTSSSGVVVSAVHPTAERLLVARGQVTAEEAMSDLRKGGLEVFSGCWAGEVALETAEESIEHWPYVAAVSFVSNEEVPGVWVDAYSELPAQVTVLRRLYEDFRGTGELEEVAFEEFVRLARPNVVIVSPSDLLEYLRTEQKPASSIEP